MLLVPPVWGAFSHTYDETRTAQKHIKKPHAEGKSDISQLETGVLSARFSKSSRNFTESESFASVPKLTPLLTLAGCNKTMVSKLFLIV